LGDQLFLEGIYNKIVAQTWADVTVFLNSNDKHFLCLRGWLSMATPWVFPGSAWFQNVYTWTEGYRCWKGVLQSL